VELAFIELLLIILFNKRMLFSIFIWLALTT